MSSRDIVALPVTLGSPGWNPDSNEGHASVEYIHDGQQYTFEAHDGANSVYINTDVESLRCLVGSIETLISEVEGTPVSDEAQAWERGYVAAMWNTEHQEAIEEGGRIRADNPYVQEP